MIIREKKKHILDTVYLTFCLSQTCNVADFSLCTWYAVIAANRFSFLQDFAFSSGAALTAYWHRHLVYEYVKLFLTYSVFTFLFYWCSHVIWISFINILLSYKMFFAALYSSGLWNIMQYGIVTNNPEKWEEINMNMYRMTYSSPHYLHAIHFKLTLTGQSGIKNTNCGNMHGLWAYML